MQIQSHMIYQDRVTKCRWLTSEMLSTKDDWLRNDNELTSSKLKAKLLEWCINPPNVALSAMIKMLENYCISVMLSYDL